MTIHGWTLQSLISEGAVRERVRSQRSYEIFEEKCMESLVTRAAPPSMTHVSKALTKWILRARCFEGRPCKGCCRWTWPVRVKIPSLFSFTLVLLWRKSDSVRYSRPCRIMLSSSLRQSHIMCLFLEYCWESRITMITLLDLCICIVLHYWTQAWV